MLINIDNNIKDIIIKETRSALSSRIWNMACYVRALMSLHLIIMPDIRSRILLHIKAKDGIQ
jgi:hypothetical protein